MSLRPDDSHHRSRSKSPGRRDRSRSRTEDDRPRDLSRSRQAYERDASPARRNYADEEGERDVYRKYEERIRTTRDEPKYAVESEYAIYRDDGGSGSGRGHLMSGARHNDDLAYGKIEGRDYAKEEKYKKEFYDPRSGQSSTYGYGDTRFAVGDDRHGHGRGLSVNVSGGFNVGHTPATATQSYAQQYGPSSYSQGPPQDPRNSSTSFIEQPKYDYYKTNDNYNTRPTTLHSQSYESETKSYSRTPSSTLQTINVEPGHRPPLSPGLAPQMSSLSVYGHNSHHSLSSAPPSPLQEAYHGTYQSISPMPSPLLLATNSTSSIDILEPLSPHSSTTRHARFHDPSDDAQAIASAISASRKYHDLGPLIQILPSLTHAQMMDLRSEYKKIVKTGSGHDIKGVNIAKHIKLRLKEEEKNFAKAAYVCALGQWESEAYWANFWYHGEKSNRELLIESLMGRTNREIGMIKDGFRDKKYGDSLVKCMKTELKEDKFKKAVLLTLDEKRMEESRSGRIDKDLVDEDVYTLHKALKSERGGESAMIGIIIVRSDSHMRECLRVYEANYHSNFARDMLKKSGNLVGELLAHILNGIINPPVRDALLLHQAIKLALPSFSHHKHDESRPDLLISRIIRYHWDRPHFEKVKKEYRVRYGVELIDAVREVTAGDFGEFMQGLCVRRMGDEVAYVR